MVYLVDGMMYVEHVKLQINTYIEHSVEYIDHTNGIDKVILNTHLPRNFPALQSSPHLHNFIQLFM